MITILTWPKLQESFPCNEAVIWGKEKYKEQESQDSIQVIKDLMEDKKLDWANWLIVRLMDWSQYLAYAIFSAEQVLDIYEEKYPTDNRPRKAIEAAKKVLENNNEENRESAYRANTIASAAYMAANYATSATSAAYMAANTAAMASAAYATSAASAASAAYAASAASAASLAKEEMLIKILKYGIELMKFKKRKMKQKAWPNKTAKKKL